MESTESKKTSEAAESQKETIHIQDICDIFGLLKKDAARVAKEAGAIRKDGRWPVYDIEKIRDYIESGKAENDEDKSENKLLALRKKFGLTQREAQALTGVPKRTYEGWEQGHTVPPEWLLSLVLEKLEANAKAPEAYEKEGRKMKKIINGKMYNTETAKLVGESEASCGRSDFNWYEEGLYKKKTGEFFLAGSGNARSKYAQATGQNSWTGGEGIVPLTEEEAKEYAEKYLTVDEYVAIFGEPEE